MHKKDCAEIGILRNINSKELELMLSWRNSPSIRNNMYTRHEISKQEHFTWWEKIQESNTDKYFMYEQNNKPSGIVSFNKIDLINENSLWAFYAAPDAPRGTGSRMEYLALECAFNSLGLHKLCCEVLAFNLPVIKLHKKFGFIIEGILRDQHKIDDDFVDVYKIGILASEWLSLRESMFTKIKIKK